MEWYTKTWLTSQKLVKNASVSSKMTSLSKKGLSNEIFVTSFGYKPLTIKLAYFYDTKWNAFPFYFIKWGGGGEFNFSYDNRDSVIAKLNDK